MNALIQEQGVTRALRNSKKDSKSSKKGQKDFSENSSDSDGSDSGEEWGEVLVLNPGEKGSSHRVTTTTLGTVKGNQETTENIYILLDTGCSNTIISKNYLNLCKSIKNLNLDIPRQ